jgi:ArsR family transcriptional regulator, arsenate/arsenite/antimonite-responsive transcriptional repressor / arsenate reductase (thioredoxin)
LLSFILRSVSFDVDPALARRAQCYAALSDPGRLAIVEELLRSDRTPSELGRVVHASSNLLAHHLDTLETAGLIGRTQSTGDARRRYVHLVTEGIPALGGRQLVAPQEALFVCTQNSARSQLAAALWTAITGRKAMSAGTHPADHVHKLAVSAARRAGLLLGAARPVHLDSIPKLPALTVTVCDQVHEELVPAAEWLHWSVPDPVVDGHAAAFDAAITMLRLRIETLVGRVAA